MCAWSRPARSYCVRRQPKGVGTSYSVPERPRQLGKLSGFSSSDWLSPDEKNHLRSIATRISSRVLSELHRSSFRDMGRCRFHGDISAGGSPRTRERGPDRARSNTHNRSRTANFSVQAGQSMGKLAISDRQAGRSWKVYGALLKISPTTLHFLHRFSASATSEKSFLLLQNVGLPRQSSRRHSGTSHGPVRRTLLFRCHNSSDVDFTEDTSPRRRSNGRIHRNHGTGWIESDTESCGESERERGIELTMAAPA